MLAALVAFATSAAQPLKVVLPFGVSSQVSRDFDKIAKMTEKGDFAGARSALRLLPGRVVKIQWDDSSAPQALRFDLNRQRDNVLLEWGRGATALTMGFSDKEPDICVTFKPNGEEEFVWSEDPKQPRLTIKIGLENDGKPVDPTLIHNEFSYGLGTYLGVSKLPLPATIMSGPEMAASGPIGLLPLETYIANASADACQSVKDAVMRSQPVTSGLPAIAEDPAPVKKDDVFQGDKVPFDFSLKNSGEGELAFRIIPDCSCFSTRIPKKNTLSGQTQVAQVQMDTREFAGTVHKTLYLFSNDPANPVRTIPVELKIKPRYRMFPAARNYVAGDDGSVTVTAYLYAPPERPLNVTGAASEGLPGDVSFEPWEGKMADPDLGEQELPRKGYKFTLKIANIPDGSQLGTNIAIATDDPIFPKLNYQVFVQKGIIALPQSVYLGEVGASPRKMSFLLTRPGRDFKITSLESDSKHLTASSSATKSGEYRITINYDGQAEKGDYHATISIKTDDPKQPLIEVPVIGMIR